MPLNIKQNYLITIAGITCALIGMLFFAFYHQWIIISFPCSFHSSATHEIKTHKKKSPLFFWHANSWKHEDVDVIWSSHDTAQNIEYLVNRWLSLCDEEKVIHKKVTLQSVIMSPSDKEAFLSFDRNPFDPQDATYDKFMLIESLLKTIRENNVPITSIRLLVHHAPLEDEHLDFSFSWPLEGFLTSAGTGATRHTSCVSNTSRKPFTIMIDPAGDAKHAGRTLDDNFERGITLQCSQKLKKLLEAQLNKVRVVLTRFPGETLEPMQNANFANRLNVDMYLSIHFYHEAEHNSSLNIYQYVKQPTDCWGAQYTQLSLVPYDQIHLISGAISECWRTHMVDTLKKQLKSRIISTAMPFLPLKGIKAPALGIEIGLRSKSDWHHYTEPLARAIKDVIENR